MDGKFYSFLPDPASLLTGFLKKLKCVLFSKKFDHKPFQKRLERKLFEKRFYRKRLVGVVKRRNP
ncbi:MAG: hypothetical protein AAY43_12220 [Methanosarcina sp. 795]|uniref:hypothetical protein n=1 Tax=Methanosarcina thermophila TaxID=2210 RepID=UPI00064EE6E6|nr:hypothetical protein [Methanosarcina thermophila]ALK06306.1 MAG: hypothetical protein AAY43_12220 [Methanosarcina sp. 795]NLU57373.1 hypothetical protein [Methanosarcina thermophila]HOA68702.1 hypothetical protein [Methanosarcina thermophila]HOQ65186.1 hypothetical protein [Methanosarcina thermophila]HPT80697.1 hypothetical protein [Methanosarcina thermophila]